MNDARRFRVVIAGAGVAGLETMLAVRELAGDRVDLTLVAPDDEFVYRPLGVEEPYAVGRIRRVALKQAAADAAATFVPGIVEDLDPAAQLVRFRDRTRASTTRSCLPSAPSRSRRSSKR